MCVCVYAWICLYGRMRVFVFQFKSGAHIAYKHLWKHLMESVECL